MKRNIIYLVLAALCVGVFSLYLLVANSRLDTQPPEISFPNETSQFLTQDGTEAFLRDVTAHDRQDGDVTASLVVDSVRLADKDGTIHITYAAFDKAGNVKKAVRTARYTDYTSPRFALQTSMSFASNTSFDLFQLVRAEDMLDGDISHRIRVTTLDDTSESGVGERRVELRVSNSIGDTVRLEIPVEVYKVGTYDARLTLTDYLIYIPRGGMIDEESYLDAFTVGTTTQNLRGRVPEKLTVDIQSNVQSNEPGVYTVKYRAGQTVGTGDTAKTYTGYAKLIVVVEG